MKILLLYVFVTSAAFAGKSGSGGGKGVVCRFPDGNVTVELLDLWEARVVYGRQIKTSGKQVVAQISETAENLKNAFSTIHTYRNANAEIPNSKPYLSIDAKGKQLASDLKGISYFFLDTEGLFRTDNKKLPLRNTKLTLTEDSYEVARPIPPCEIEQIITYQDIGNGKARVYINQDLIDKMDNTNLAALYLHESLYTVLRQKGRPNVIEEQNSLRTRRAIGLAFSGHKFKNFRGTLPAEFILCNDQDARRGLLGTRLYFHYDSKLDVTVSLLESFKNTPLIDPMWTSTRQGYSPVSYFWEFMEGRARGKNDFGIFSDSEVDFDLAGNFEVENLQENGRTEGKLKVVNSATFPAGSETNLSCKKISKETFLKTGGANE